MRRIVICCDGTGADENKAQISNVLLTHRAIEAAGNSDQISWYDRGVGTGGGLDAVSGLVNGVGLTANIVQAYLQLVEQYESALEAGEKEEDIQIFLFGFSRGAYTVRSLAGLIRNIGLLRRDTAGRLWAGLEMYRNRRGGPKSKMARRFRFMNSREVKIEFLGVWDTVGSTGAAIYRAPETSLIHKILNRIPLINQLVMEDDEWFKKYGFHDHTLSRIVKTGFHALAVDEKRRPFQAQIWFDPKYDGKSKTLADEDCTDVFDNNHPWLASESSITDYTDNELEQFKKDKLEQEVHQRWFVGCHSDIGGGNTPHGLSNLTLKWMLDAARSKGLELNDNYLSVYASTEVTQEIHESFGSFYKRLGATPRVIGLASEAPEGRDPSKIIEDLDDSVITRWNLDSKYRPSPLVEYKKDHPKVFLSRDQKT